MGPPKKRPTKTSYLVLRQRLDIFEYRWDASSQSYFLFNPWTGETIFNTDVSALDRSKSMWAKPEKYPSEIAKTTTIYPEYYASRRWGRRRFCGFSNEEAAALHMTAVARGFLARVALKRYFRERFHTLICQFSGYYYFVDKLNLNEETSWYKPRLAFPGDILPLEEDDPEDHMKGKKFSDQNIRIGPFWKVRGLNKKNTARSSHIAFLKPNPLRDQAIRKYSEIDFESAQLNDVVAWMDSDKASAIYLTEFHFMRTAICEGDWSRVLRLMNDMHDNFAILVFGFHSFSKSKVPLDVSGVLDYSSGEAMELCGKMIRSTDGSYGPMVKIFAMAAFHNILSVRPGRLEYLNTNLVPEQGELRQAAVEAFLNDRLSIFNRYLTVIPQETINVYEKGAKDPTPVSKPLKRAIDMIEAAMKCLCVLAHESETKEQLALIAVPKVVFAMQVCEDEAYIMLHGIQFFYNLCYRCESGQEAILACLDVEGFFSKLYHNHSGDPDVMRQARRLQLALMHNGWRGQVEDLITKELRGEVLSEEYLTPANFGKK